MIRQKKLILTLFLIAVILSVVFVSLKFGVFSAKAAEVTNISDISNIISNDKPLDRLITDSIREIEEEEARILQEDKKLEIEARRLQEEEDRLEAERLAIENDPNARFAYLTFDDGPSKNVTPAILDILKEYDIKATFFVVGYMVDRNPEILQRIYDEGHAIGNHSYSHNYNYIYQNANNFMEDIRRAESKLKEVLGQEFETKLLRFPGGSFGKYKSPMIRAAEKEGYAIYDWNSLNGDAEGLNLSNAYLKKRLKDTTRNKKEAIVLMHDIDSKVGTLETLSYNIDYLISQGFHFRVLKDNIE